MKKLLLTIVLLFPAGAAVAQNGAFEIIDSPPARAPANNVFIVPQQQPQFVIQYPSQPQPNQLFPNQQQQRIDRALDQQYDMNLQIMQQRNQANYDKMIDNLYKMPSR